MSTCGASKIFFENHPRAWRGFFMRYAMSCLVRMIFSVFIMSVLFLPPQLAAADLQAAAPSADAANAADAQGAENVPDTDKAEAASLEETKTPWEEIWTGQKESLNSMRNTVVELSNSFASQTGNLNRHLQPFEEEGRRLLVFANTFKAYPNALEAVQRRIQANLEEFNNVLEPVLRGRSEAQALLERVTKMGDSIPDDLDQSRLSPEMQTYIQDINKARLKLIIVLAQYDSLAPSLSLMKKLETARDEIGRELPALWKNYYLKGPIPWLSMDYWKNIGQRLYYSWHALILRLPVEVPVKMGQWGGAFLRFAVGLVFAGALCLLLRRRWPENYSGEVRKHIFRTSLPWLCIGFALLGSAFSAMQNFYRFFLALGSLCLIVGEVFLAWDIRLLNYSRIPDQPPPFLRLLPLAFMGYLLAYSPLAAGLALIAWIALVIICLCRRKKAKTPDMGDLQFEGGALDCEAIVLWLCLFLGVSGLFIPSMALYLAYVSLSLALELALGGMYLVNSINDHIAKDNAKAFAAHLGIAMAAPLVLVIAVASVFLWVAVLPGGIYLLAEYAFKGINIGETQFSIIQLLLIISVFYLTRALVSMGTRFLAKLPSQGINFDATLITPLQTALTYFAWAIFGLFVLRALGLELSNLAMVAGGLSVGIGFGMQTIVNNFFSGLILIFGRTLQVGDVVEAAGITGRVRKISVRATMVETYDNAIIYVPNSQLMSSSLINWTSFSRSVRKEVQVGVAYGTDTEKAIQLLVSIAKNHSNVLKYPVPSVNFADFAASSLDLRLRFWVKDFEMGSITCSDIRLQIEKVFAEENIEIAYPQLDVHLKGEEKERAEPVQAAVRPRRTIAKHSSRRRSWQQFARKAGI